jgi:hypothetical protein
MTALYIVSQQFLFQAGENGYAKARLRFGAVRRCEQFDELTSVNCGRWNTFARFPQARKEMVNGD